jgi:hypothetical protein
MPSRFTLPARTFSRNRTTNNALTTIEYNQAPLFPGVLGEEHREKKRIEFFCARVICNFVEKEMIFGVFKSVSISGCREFKNGTLLFHEFWCIFWI